MEIISSMPPVMELAADFSVIWQEGERLRTSRGYYATCSITDEIPGTGVHFCRDENRLSAQRRASELMLECALAGCPAGGAVWCADEEPQRMSEANSRSFCCGFMDALHRNHLPFPPVDGNLPRRERDFLTDRAALLRPGIPRKKKPSAALCGKGLLFLAEHILRHCDGRGLLGRSLCIVGDSDAAEETRKQAQRMGCDPCREGGILLLFDRREPLPEHFPSVIFEAAGCTLSACETAAYSAHSTLLCPSIVHGAGMALFEAASASDDPWQTDALLRRSVELVGERTLAEGGDLYRGAYTAAFRRMGGG